MADVQEGSKFSDLGNRVKYGVPLAIIAVVCLSFEPTAYLLITLVGIAFAVEVLWRVATRAEEAGVASAMYGWGLFFLGIIGFLIARDLRAEQNGFWIIVLVACGIVATDIGAYAGGRAYGGDSHPFPKLSPNKTTTGFVSGAVAGMVTLLLGWILLNMRGLTSLEIWNALLVVVLVPIAGIAGDLYESKTKRMLGIKDFSNLLGSHGGVADRFDAMVAAFIVYGAIFYWTS